MFLNTLKRMLKIIRKTQMRNNNIYQQYKDKLKLLINTAKAKPGGNPETLAKEVSLRLLREKNSLAEEMKITRYLESRGITNLIHFTKINNLESIFEYGLIPRQIMEDCEAIRIVLKPRFSDWERRGGYKEANCFSISFPNYRMFYKKSHENQDGWAVIVFGTKPMQKTQCYYCSGNTATSDSKVIKGINGLKNMFDNPEKREELGIPDWYTTDPQAEVLNLFVIPPYLIREVHLFSNENLPEVIKLAKSHNIYNNENIKVEKQYFWAREDRAHWNSPDKPQVFNSSVISDNGHWEALKSAVSESHKTLCVLSGFISNSVINEEIISLLRKALARGVKIYLGYGYEFGGEHRKTIEAKLALERLEELRGQNSGECGLYIKEFANHSKLVVVDDKYVIYGSNNWLSNRRGKNDELSRVIESKFSLDNHKEVKDHRDKIIRRFEDKSN
jgi:hypothetical protein